MPILDVLRTYLKNALLAMGMRIAENGTFYILTAFVLTYIVEEVGLEQGTGLTGVIIAAAIGLFTVPFFGGSRTASGGVSCIPFRGSFLAAVRLPSRSRRALDRAVLPALEIRVAYTCF